MMKKKIILFSLVFSFLSTSLILAQGALPDLKVTRVTVLQDCKLRITIKNIGQGAVPQGGKVSISLKEVLPRPNPDRPLESWSADVVNAQNQPLGPGQEMTYTSNWIFGHGMKVKITLSTAGRFSESNTANNITEHYTGCMPDLVIQDISLNQSKNVVIKIGNIGSGNISEAHWVRKTPHFCEITIFKDGVRWGAVALWAFDPQKKLAVKKGSVVHVSNLKIQGRAKVKVQIDAANDILERNENNNIKEQQLPKPIIPIKK
jgi:hypothetical protein